MPVQLRMSVARLGAVAFQAAARCQSRTQCRSCKLMMCCIVASCTRVAPCRQLHPYLCVSLSVCPELARVASQQGADVESQEREPSWFRYVATVCWKLRDCIVVFMVCVQVLGVSSSYCPLHHVWTGSLSRVGYLNGDCQSGLFCSVPCHFVSLWSFTGFSAGASWLLARCAER